MVLRLQVIIFSRVLTRVTASLYINTHLFRRFLGLLDKTFCWGRLLSVLDQFRLCFTPAEPISCFQMLCITRYFDVYFIFRVFPAIFVDCSSLDHPAPLFAACCKWIYTAVGSGRVTEAKTADEIRNQPISTRFPRGSVMNRSTGAFSSPIAGGC